MCMYILNRSFISHYLLLIPTLIVLYFSVLRLVLEVPGGPLREGKEPKDLSHQLPLRVHSYRKLELM